MPKAKLSLPPNTRGQLHIYIGMKWPPVEMEEQSAAASQADGGGDVMFMDAFVWQFICINSKKK